LCASTIDNKRPLVVIVGGGISGLSVAYYLAKHSIRSLLLEKTPRVGGLVQTDQIAGCTLEAGPDSFIAAKPAVAELAQQLGVADQIIGSNDQDRATYIVRSGKLVPMPKGMAMMVPGDLKAAFKSPLFGAGAKLRFLRELRSRPRSRSADLSIREFVRSHFGDQLSETIAEPLLSGVYGGNAGSLSAKAVLPRFLEYERTQGSLIRSVQREQARHKGAEGSIFRSFRDGMQTVINALASAVSSHCEIRQAEALQVDRNASGAWRVDHGNGSVETSTVVLACPAHVSARLISSSVPDLATEYRSIPYSSAILVTFVFEAKAPGSRLPGFGFLVPPKERQTIAAATWVSTKFPFRTPPGLTAVRAFIVGEEAERLMSASDEVIRESVRDDLKRLMQLDDSPQFSTLYRWPQSMPQYVVGHLQRRERIQQLMMKTEGLYACGNAFIGVGLSDSVRMAEATAKAIFEDRPCSFLDLVQ
jgi:protoporphyrinogen/coproporphyrinogen III oxidase